MNQRVRARKFCFVPKCDNTNLSNKIFVGVPHTKEIKSLWFLAANRTFPKSDKTRFYCCEDHFNIPNDVQNFVEHQLTGRTCVIKEGVVPHKFHCQPERKCSTPPPTSVSKELERQRLVKEAMDEYERNAYSLASISKEFPKVSSQGIYVIPESKDKPKDSRLNRNYNPAVVTSSQATEHVQIKEELTIEFDSYNHHEIKKEIIDETIIKHEPLEDNDVMVDYVVECVKEDMVHKVKAKPPKPPKQTYKCDLCNILFRTLTGLKKHVMNHPSKTFHCKQCGKSFNKLTMLHKHIKQTCDKYNKVSHIENNLYKCIYCGILCNTLRQLRFHGTTDHNDAKMFSCHHCGASFKQNKYLKYHFLVHSNLKPFKCKKCPKAFKSQLYLKQHQTTHSRHKPFKCGECDERAFRRACELKKHYSHSHSVNAISKSRPADVEFILDEDVL